MNNIEKEQNSKKILKLLYSQRKTKSDVREQYGIVRFSKRRFCVERL